MGTFLAWTAWHIHNSAGDTGGGLKDIIIWVALLIVLAVVANWGLKQIEAGIIRTLATVVLVVVALLIVINILFSL